MLDSFVLGVVSGLTLLGMNFWGAYKEYVWFDNVAHVLGGTMVASAVKLLAELLSLPSGALPVLAGTFTIGIGWELFEWAKNIHPWDSGDPSERDDAWEDTALDMVMVMAGAYAAVRILQYL